MKNELGLHAGEWVVVRGKEEILRTLDERGRLDQLPFMPQMFDYCGKKLRVVSRAHKTCDTVNKTGGRRMANAVHLEAIRCDGQVYGGCQAACLIFWKEAWLKRASQTEEPPSGALPFGGARGEGGEAAKGCSEADVLAETKASGEEKSDDPTYTCQATQLPSATRLLPWWDVRQYLQDHSSGNVGISRMVRGFIYAAYDNLINAGIGLGAILRWIYDRFQALWGGIPYPRHVGKIPAGGQTPTLKLNLQPGELVRVKSYEGILQTVDKTNKNRGLYFDAEMVPYCGGTYRVLQRVSRILNEKTGKMMIFKNECIMLEGVVCQSRYSNLRFFCPRAIYSYWRENWLERVSEPQTAEVRPDTSSAERPQLKQ